MDNKKQNKIHWILHYGMWKNEKNLLGKNNQKKQQRSQWNCCSSVGLERDIFCRRVCLSHPGRRWYGLNILAVNFRQTAARTALCVPDVPLHPDHLGQYFCITVCQSSCDWSGDCQPQVVKGTRLKHWWKYDNYDRYWQSAVVKR